MRHTSIRTRFPPELQPTVKFEVIFCVRGVISPLLSNVYLHWFDKLFQRADGPAQWAGAKLVRYADDFVVLARYQGTRLRGGIESKLEGWLGLEINQEKTRVVNLKEEGASPDFLGFTFRYYEDLQGRGWRYLNLSPSAQALKKERARLRQYGLRRAVCRALRVSGSTRGEWVEPQGVALSPTLPTWRENLLPVRLRCA